MAQSGMLVVMMDASVGELMLTPRMKQPWLSTIANSEAKNSVTMSLGLTCSGFWNREAIQKSSIAPPTRRSVITKGLTAPDAIISLETGDIRPHIVFAPSIAAWPFRLNFISVNFLSGFPAAKVGEWYCSFFVLLR